VIYVTGDIHGNIKNFKRFDLKNFRAVKSMTKKDFVIVCGDFGAPWYPYGHVNSAWDKEVVNKFEEQPFTTLFVDGNHENFHNLNSLPEVEMFGDIVGKVSDSIFHLKRGRVYEINNKKILTMGGATSHDKLHRLATQSQYDFQIWWKEEEWTKEEQEICVENLRKYDGEVDYVITHTLPQSVLRTLTKRLGFRPDEDSVSLFFDRLIELNELKKFKKWYCGHFHCNERHYDFHILYEKVIKLI